MDGGEPRHLLLIFCVTSPLNDGNIVCRARQVNRPCDSCTASLFRRPSRHARARPAAAEPLSRWVLIPVGSDVRVNETRKRVIVMHTLRAFSQDPAE